MTIKTFDAYSRLSFIDINRITNFLFDHSGDFRDSKSAIKKAILYAAKEISGLGGYVFVLENERDIIGAVVINKTGMLEYMPENILVYLAVNEKFRGRGVAKRLLNYAINYCKGDIGLYVNKENPVVKLFEKEGFQSENIEMRLLK